MERLTRLSLHGETEFVVKILPWYLATVWSARSSSSCMSHISWEFEYMRMRDTEGCLYRHRKASSRRVNIARFEFQTSSAILLLADEHFELACRYACFLHLWND